MKKMFALAVLCTGVCAAAWFSSCNNSSGDLSAKKKADSLAQAVERGRYLANHVAACIHCHSERDFSKFSGPVVPGTEGSGGLKYDSHLLEAIPGTIYAKNITPDKETGIGNWTDEELLRSITQGISKNGDTLFPLMPYVSYNKMAKADLLDIIAYLRSLKPIYKKVPARQLMIPISMAYPAPALKPTLDGNIRPAETDPVKYGEYLITVADCATCHTPFEKGAFNFARIYAGGNVFNHEKFRVASANITPDSTGIGGWSEEQFMNKFTLYRDAKNITAYPGKQNTVMPLVDYSGMTDNDLKALFAYLRTVKPMSNKVAKYPGTDDKEWKMGDIKVVK